MVLLLADMQYLGSWAVCLLQSAGSLPFNTSKWTAGTSRGAGPAQTGFKRPSPKAHAVSSGSSSDSADDNDNGSNGRDKSDSGDREVDPDELEIGTCV